MLKRQVLLACLFLAASLFTLGFGPPVLTDGGYPPVRLYPEQIDALRTLSRRPEISARAALMIDLDSGQTLYARAEHEPMAPGSTIKIMTALLALQAAGLSDTVVVSQRAAATDGSTMYLQAGEALTVNDLLYGLLLPSGNDAAVALAEHVAGSEADFVARMNQAAVEMGLSNTRFTNPHGLDDPAQVTSAHDLVLMARRALEYPVFAQIVATQTAEVAGRQLENTNQMLGAYEGADGIKTGTTDVAGECLVVSQTRRGHRLILALLGSQDRYADARVLFDYAAAGWVWQPVTLPDDGLAWYPAPDGERYRLRTDGSPDVFLPTWQSSRAEFVRVIDFGVPITATMPVGRLRLTVDGRVIGDAPLTVLPGP